MGVRWSVNSALDFGMKRDDCHLGLLHCVMSFLTKLCSTLAVITYTVTRTIYPVKDHFQAALSLCLKVRPPAKPFICKRMETIYTCERFCTSPRFKTEAMGISEMAYSTALHVSKFTGKSTLFSYTFYYYYF